MVLLRIAQSSSHHLGKAMRAALEKAGLRQPAGSRSSVNREFRTVFGKQRNYRTEGEPHGDCSNNIFRILTKVESDS